MKIIILIGTCIAATLGCLGAASAQYYFPAPGYYDGPPRGYYRERYYDDDAPRYRRGGMGIVYDRYGRRPLNTASSEVLVGR